MRPNLIMRKLITLPQIELNMETAIVGRWLVNLGGLVAIEQPILEVETQKAVAQVPSSDAGYLRAQCVKAGDTIGKNAALCVLTDTPDEAFEMPVGVVAGAGRAESERVPLPGRVEGESDAVKAVPAARKIAKVLGVNLATLKGTGPGGRITVADVQSIHPTNGCAAECDENWKEMPPSRVALNAQMQKSLEEIPQIHIARQMEVAPLLVQADGVTFTHRLARAVALALAKHPALRTVVEQTRTKVAAVSVAIAMDTPLGLVAPALRQADKMSLRQIVAATNDFRARGAAGTLRREELINAPFAVTNLGMLGVDFFSAFVFHGQTAVLAVGRSAEAKDGGKRAWFNLAVDHRVVDGAEAARFLETLQTEILTS
jgi:pyruvate dehydrogenase E2 component (dihydrolipoamide acetyltransferase)